MNKMVNYIFIIYLVSWNIDFFKPEYMRYLEDTLFCDLWQIAFNNNLLLFIFRINNLCE